MPRNAQVADESFAQVRGALGSDQAVVKLVGVITAYNVVSRFLVALDVDPE